MENGLNDWLDRGLHVCTMLPGAGCGYEFQILHLLAVTLLNAFQQDYSRKSQALVCKISHIRLLLFIWPLAINKQTQT